MKFAIVMTGAALMLAACGQQAAEKAGAKADSVITQATDGKIDSSGVALKQAGEKVDAAASQASSEAKKLASEAKVEAGKAGTAIKADAKKVAGEVKDAEKKPDK